MTNLDKYADELIEELNKYDDFSEDEKIRFIYISLGKKLIFDLNWVYGNDFTRGSIYYKNETPEIADNYESDEKWPMICKSISYTLSYICKKIGINVEVVQDEPNSFLPYPHVYNKVIKKDGSTYFMDLYADLPNINMNRRTEFFGFIDYISPRIFSRKQLEEMDYRNGYVSKAKPYTDEYFDMLKDYISRMDSIYDKILVILENPSPYLEFNLEYDERRRHIINTINYLLKDDRDKGWKWEWLDCYYYNDNRMLPKELIYVKEGEKIHFFEYNPNTMNFNQITNKELSKQLTSGLRIPDRCSSPEYSWIFDVMNTQSNNQICMIEKEKNISTIDKVYNFYYKEHPTNDPNMFELVDLLCNAPNSKEGKLKLAELVDLEISRLFENKIVTSENDPLCKFIRELEEQVFRGKKILGEFEDYAKRVAGISFYIKQKQRDMEKPDDFTYSNPDEYRCLMYSENDFDNAGEKKFDSLRELSDFIAGSYKSVEAPVKYELHTFRNLNDKEKERRIIQDVSPYIYPQEVENFAGLIRRYHGLDFVASAIRELEIGIPFDIVQERLEKRAEGRSPSFLDSLIIRFSKKGLDFADSLPSLATTDKEKQEIADLLKDLRERNARYEEELAQLAPQQTQEQSSFDTFTEDPSEDDYSDTEVPKAMK